MSVPPSRFSAVVSASPTVLESSRSREAMSAGDVCPQQNGPGTATVAGPTVQGELLQRQIEAAGPQQVQQREGISAADIHACEGVQLLCRVAFQLSPHLKVCHPAV